MSLFLLRLPSGTAKVNGVSSLVVEAKDATAAKEIADLLANGDGPWSIATADDIVTTGLADLDGWEFKVKVGPAVTAPDTGAEVDVSYVGEAADDLDDVGAGLKAALISAGFANADYTALTRLVTVAIIPDGMGKRSLVVEVIPAGSIRGDCKQANGQFVKALVHKGVAGAVLTVEFEDILTTVPGILFAF